MQDNSEHQLDKLFAALSDSTRRLIVRRLLGGDVTVSDLAEPFDMSLAAISKHIAVLVQAGLVTQSREGRIKWCRLNIDSLHSASVWMSAFGEVLGIDYEKLEQSLEESGLLSEKP